MRAYKRFDKRGFTLVELMIVVAIIGVLAALAIYGVTKYLASAKTSEAKDKVGAIARSAVAAYERENYKNEMLADGASSATATHSFCASATRVPSGGNPPKGTKYQPSTAPDKDFNQGDAQTGWPCLQFSITQPIYYQYGYEKGTGTGLSGAKDFEAQAFGDLNGDGTKFSTFARGGELRNGQVVLSTTIFTKDETE